MPDFLIFVNSDLINDSNLYLIVHSICVPASISSVLVHQPEVDSVTALSLSLSLEGDGVRLTCDTPKKAIVPADGWRFSVQRCLAQSVYLVSVKLIIWKCKQIPPKQCNAIKSQTKQLKLSECILGIYVR